MPDILYCQDGSKVRNFNKSDAQAQQLFDEIKGKFPWFDQDTHRAVSEAYPHEVLGERVIRTCVMIANAEAALSKRVITAHRLFSMDSGTSMLYVTVLFDGDAPPWLPQDAFILGVTEHHEEFRRPVKPEMLQFSEYFFVLPVEAMSLIGVDISDVNADTVFSALVVGDRPVAWRRYTNFVETDTGVLANWQMAYVLHAKLARRLDLVRSLFSLPYLHQFDVQNG